MGFLNGRLAGRSDPRKRQEYRVSEIFISVKTRDSAVSMNSRDNALVVSHTIPGPWLLKGYATCYPGHPDESIWIFNHFPNRDPYYMKTLLSGRVAGMAANQDKGAIMSWGLGDLP